VNFLDSSQVLQLIAWFIALMDLILGLYILVLNIRSSANLHVGVLLLIFAFNNFGTSLLVTAQSPADAFLPTALLAATTTAATPGLLIIAVNVLKPQWLSGRGRYYWRTLYVLAVLPILLTIIDATLGTNLYFTGPDPNTYQGGYLTLSEYTQGSISIFIRVINIYIITVLTLIPLLYVALFDRTIPKQTKQLAYLLLVTLFAAIINTFVLTRFFEEALTTIISTAIYVAGYGYAGFQQMISERRLQRGRLGPRLTALFLVITIPLMIGLSEIVSSRAIQQLEVEAETNLSSTNKTILNNTTLWLDANVDALQLMISIPAITSMDAEQQLPVVRSMADTYPHMYLVSTTDTSGINIVRNDDEEPKDYHDRAWVLGALIGEPLTFQTLVGRTSGEPALVASMPIKNASGDILGVGMFATDLDDVTTQIAVSEIGENRVAYIVDADNQVLAHPNPDFMAELRDFTDEPPIRALRAGARGMIAYTDADGERWRAYIDELEYGWGIVVQQKEADFLATTRGFQILSTILITGSLVLLVILAILTVRQVIRPIGTLTETATAIAGGDLTRLAPVESEDEFGILAQAFNRMTERLLELISGLERSVADRTSDLERRSALLQAASEVAGAATSILETDQLIQNIVEFIRDRFDLYYVGLFLTDQAGEWAVLQSGTGEAGQAMLARGHRIKIGEGMIGWSIANAKSRVALEAGVDAMRLATKELPKTRSEAAIPLRSRGQVLGALTIQDSQPEAFDELFIDVLQTMANQVAIAIDNARLLDASQEALETTQRIFGEMSSRAWLELVRQQTNLVFRSDEMGNTTADDVWKPEMDKVFEEGKTVQFTNPETSTHALAVPILARGQIIGLLDTYKPIDEGRWTPEEITVIETIVDQVGVALESARLFEDTRRRAAREELVREISDQMQQATDMQSLMQIAAEEIKQALGVSRTVLRIGLDNTPSGNGDGNNEI
jgi:GAF domain-containing protein/HAMP domain-containing protein